MFLTLPYACLRCEKRQYIINILKNILLSDKELNNLIYQERFNLLNNNPVLVTRLAQYKDKVFFI